MAFVNYGQKTFYNIDPGDLSIQLFFFENDLRQNSKKVCSHSMVGTWPSLPLLEYPKNICQGQTH
jgi:hypothetical protein